MSKILSLYRTLRQFIAPASILVALLASTAGARCIGSTDPVIQRMELETGRNPAAAVALISKEIADTNPANRRRLTELYLAKSQALYMSGASMDPALAKAREIGSGYGPTDNIGMYLRISEAIGKADAAETAKDLQSLAGGLDALPDGSPAKTCRATDFAYYNSAIERSREAMVFAAQAYRNSQDHADSPERAQAASVLALLVSTGHDFEYADRLHSEAYAIQRKHDLHDLAANELVLRGYTHLDRGDWRGALTDFETSAREARGFGNQYAVDFALLGVCEAALKGDLTQRAAPACERAYEGLSGPDEWTNVPATTFMARFLVAEGQAGRALQLLDPLVANGKGSVASEIWIEALETRAQALAQLGRSAAAYAMMRDAHEESEDYFDRELQSGVAALRTRFQTEELQKRLTAEERASDRRLRLAVAVIVGSATTLALLGTLIFFLLRHRRRFRRLAMTDPLTGLANRRATLRKADEALRTAGSARPRAAFALIDIDHFKWCNDTFGHDAGDQVLSQFARVLERCIRPADIVGRWGGEEFLVVLPATGLEEARDIIERARAEAATLVFDFAPGYRLQFSAGIAAPGETDDLVDACIKLADRRLYAAKDMGRNQTCIAGRQTQAQAAARAQAASQVSSPQAA